MLPIYRKIEMTFGGDITSLLFQYYCRIKENQIPKIHESSTFRGETGFLVDEKMPVKR